MKLMNIHISALSLLLVLAVPATAQDNNSGKSEFRRIEHNAFGVGEHLTYDVNYGFVTAGVAYMTIPRYSTMKGRKCYHIDFRVRSTSFFDALYYVRDRYQSHIDVEGLFPWKFVQRIREGGFKYDFSAWFDNHRNKAFTKDGVYDVPAYTQDVV